MILWFYDLAHKSSGIIAIPALLPGGSGPACGALPATALHFSCRPQHGHSFWRQKPPPEFKYTTSTDFPLSLAAVISSNNSSKLLKPDLPCLNVCHVVLIKLCTPIYALHSTLRGGFQDFLILYTALDHLSLNSNNDRQNEKDKNSFVSAER